MFSDLFYLSKLIDKSNAFNSIEKQQIFNYINKKQFYIPKMILLFEEEQKNLQEIQKEYDKKLKLITDNFNSDLIEEVKNQKIKSIGKFRNQIIDKKILEKKEKKEEDKILNDLFENL